MMKGIVYGFSTRMHGDMRLSDNRRSFARQLGLNADHLLKPKQVHGTDINSLGDGVISKDEPCCVITADCVPILLADSKKKIVSAIHAGWKGTQGCIVKNAVSMMMRMGSDPKDISAVIGPHIGACCYTVGVDRAQLFPNESSYWEHSWHIDLGLANKNQLIDCGVGEIDAPIFCTSCQVDQYFSYRKDTKETYGEIVSVIGIKPL